MPQETITFSLLTSAFLSAGAGWQQSERAGKRQRAGNRREREREREGGREGGRERKSTVCIERATQSVVGVCKHIGSSCGDTHIAYTGTMG